MTPHQVSDWRDLAEQASKEMDQERLIILVEQLCSALDGERKRTPVDRVEPLSQVIGHGATCGPVMAA